MNPKLIESLRQRIAEVELGAYADAIMSQTRPAVDLIIEGASEGIIGESRFGGTPDLPSAIEWPRDADGQFFAFLVQINLAELPVFEGNPFPDHGMLYVFIGLDEPASDVEHRVILWRGDETLQTALVPDAGSLMNDNYEELLPHRLRLELRSDVPHWATDEHSDLTDEMTSEEQERYRKLERSESKRVGQLLGLVSGIGQDPREDAEVVRSFDPKLLYNYRERSQLDLSSQKQWLNLLCLISRSELNFQVWDAGYLNFLIRESDLAALEFEHIYAAVESS